MTRTSPTVKRRRLAAELRARREQARLTIEEVADTLEWSGAKISRIENARVSVLPRDVKFLLRVYGTAEGSGEWDALLTLARESRQRGWWREYGDAVPEGFDTYVGLEADAAMLHIYEPENVPGLLQTEDYARAVMRATMLTATEDAIGRHVAVRMARQERLVGPDAPRLWAVVNEAVIRRSVGGSAVMCAQLAKLLDSGAQPGVTMQVMPFSAGAHAGMDGSFTILSFLEPGDPDVAYVPYYTGALYLEKSQQTTAYTLMFDHLRAAALAPGASRDLIARARDELT
ncbi:MAG TPA: helix-turn-helix transcriptional regulator [Streptosporangiaceae bacterium]